MMKKKWLIGFIVALVLSMSITVLASAQDDARDGSIRGTVYLDENGNGKCVDEGEPIHPGVPIEFVSDDGKWSTYLQTGDDGTYGLVSAGYGTWQVSARPNANDFVVTSEPTIAVFVGSEEKLALNINFCIQATDGVITTRNATSNAVLPQAGGGFNNNFYILAAIIGLAFLSAGAYVGFLKAE